MTRATNRLSNFLKYLQCLTRFWGEQSSVDIGQSEQHGLFYASEVTTGQRVYVSHRKRLKLYRNGFQHRQTQLLSDYRLAVDLVEAGDLVVDVGANIGEIGLWAMARGAAYIGVEPDPSAFAALSLNVPDGDLYALGLSDHAGTARFFLDTANADSSLFQPQAGTEEIEIELIRLDDLLKKAHPDGRVRLLKVEAEGMEPEVLAGAEKTLLRCDYVAVDAGPERGGENTVPQVFNALYGADFEVIDSFLRRGTFLFRARGLGKG